MKTTDPDLYQLGAQPVNRCALAELRPQEQYTPRLNLGDQPVFEARPPVQPLPAQPGGTPPLDHTGTVKGWLTVVGYGYRAATGAGAGRHKWVCKCVCGRYVYRNGKSLQEDKRTDPPDCCPYCYHIHKLRSNDKARQTGRYADGAAVQD